MTSRYDRYVLAVMGATNFLSYLDRFMLGVIGVGGASRDAREMEAAWAAHPPGSTTPAAAPA